MSARVAASEKMYIPINAPRCCQISRPEKNRYGKIVCGESRLYGVKWENFRQRLRTELQGIVQITKKQ